MRLHPFRRLREPTPVGHRHDCTEAARERAAERRVVGDGALTQISRMDIALHLDLLVRISGRSSSGVIGPARVGDDRAVRARPRQAADHVQRPLPFERGEELEQRLLALRSHDEVHVTRGREHGRGMLGRKVASPDDLHVRKCGSNALQTGTAWLSCGPGITVTASSAASVCVVRPANRAAIAARDSLRGFRQPDTTARARSPRPPATSSTAAAAACRSRRQRIEEDDHRATHTPNAAGARPSRRRDHRRRTRHPRGPRDG